MFIKVQHMQGQFSDFDFFIIIIIWQTVPGS